MRWVAPMALAFVLLEPGCTEPRVLPIIGPDGSRMFHVSCGERDGECYRLAGEYCPYGYDVGRTVGGPGNMLVRCRAPMAEPVYPTAQNGTPGLLRANPYATPSQPASPPLRPNPYAAPSQPASPPQQASPAPSASAPTPSASSLPRQVNPYGNRE